MSAARAITRRERGTRMLIVCPSCGIKYNVPASYLTKDRTLKCAGCGTSWVVKAVPPSADETVAPPAPPHVVTEQSSEAKPVAPQSGDLPAAETSESQEEAPLANAAPEAPSTPDVAAPHPEEPEPAVPQSNEPSAPTSAEQAQPETGASSSHTPPDAAAVPPVSEPQPAAPPVPSDEPVEAAHSPVTPESGLVNSLPQPVPVKKPVPDIHEQTPQFESPAQDEKQEIQQEQSVEHEDVPPPVTEVKDVTAEENSDQPDLKEEQTRQDAPHSEAPSVEASSAEVEEPVASPTPAEPTQETFSTLSEMPADQHFSTHITPRQDDTLPSSENDQTSDNGYEKPFSFLDLPVEPPPAPPPISESASPENKVVYRSIWDDEPDTSATPSAGFGTKQEEHPHEWREKDLDEHFSVGRESFSGAGYQDENLVENSEHSEHQKNDLAHPDSGHDFGDSQPHADDNDGLSVHGEPASQDGAFDDVITRLRAARNNPGGQESHTGAENTHSHAPEGAEHSSSAPWVPVWDRVADQDEETATPVEEHHETVGEHVDVPEQSVPAEPAAVVEEPAAEEEAVAAPRHVTPAIDISSRLRSDVLKRVEHADENRSSFLESPAFWRKAWIASGVGAIVVLAACTHWFGALRHLWPALNLL
ncbi:zinc ribbon domain-containing protein [Acetobacter sicerae]|uniref:zinc-ribbon domain-containing protein n=1 Tax=Acetobacter sicerae TaxID=85325 RepID=UPI0030CDC882